MMTLEFLEGKSSSQISVRTSWPDTHVVHAPHCHFSTMRFPNAGRVASVNYLAMTRSNKPVLPTATISAATNPLRPLRQQTGQSLVAPVKAGKR